jgi:hypothetical protein
MSAPIEGRIDEWRSYLAHSPALRPDDIAELEGQLREQIDGLTGSGLSPDEAFLIAVSRIGRIDELSREYGREHADRLWKQLIAVGPDEPAPRRGFALALGLACGAAVAVKVPALFGLTLTGSSADFVLRNALLLVLPFLAVFFLVRRRAASPVILTVAAAFVAAAAVMNAFPFVAGGATQLLAAIHVGVVLWLVIGVAYTGGRWRSTTARMDFIRFTGEWFVYVVLLGLGGGVLAGLTIGVFSAIGMDPSMFVVEWLLPCGAAGAVVIAAWLVEAKQSVIENIAPVLTRVFTPLFTALLVALIVAAAIHGSFVDSGRDLLIVFDLVLLVVVALLLYSLSAREPLAPAGWFDRLQLLMIVAALVVDILVLIAMIGRVGEYGASANKLASLGLNLILFANLAGAGWHHLRFVGHRGSFARVESWQTAYVPVYLGWAALVVVVFPPVFGFV